MQPIQPFGATTTLNGQQAPGSTSKLAKMCRPVRGVWLWVMIITVVLIVGGMLPLAMVSRRGGGAGAPAAARSFLGVDGFETAPGGGALVTGIAGPETPLLRAGLIGGDIIKRFDGREVRNADDMRRILGDTPVGKTVDLDFIRDNVPGSTKLTTAAEKDMPGLRLFDQRQGGAGNLELDRGDLRRVQVPGMNIYGAELGDIERNGPADIAGLRRGDIVIKFGDYPIRTPGDLRYRISEAMPGATIPVTIVRGTEQTEILVKIGRSRN
jgi:S1-C subfamily serine protease